DCVAYRRRDTPRTGTAVLPFVPSSVGTRLLLVRQTIHQRKRWAHLWGRAADHLAHQRPSTGSRGAVAQPRLPSNTRASAWLLSHRPHGAPVSTAQTVAQTTAGQYPRPVDGLNACTDDAGKSRRHAVLRHQK